MGVGAVGLMAWHLLVGLPLGVAALAACLLHLRRYGLPLTTTVALCLATGTLVVAAAAGGTPLRGHHQVVFIHLLSGLVAIGLALRFTGGVAIRLRRPRLAALAVLFIPLVAASAYRYDPDSYYRALTSTNASQAGDRTFPAGVRLEGDVPWRPRPASYCGDEGCHERSYREWHSSAHAHAGADPFYRASLEQYERRNGQAATNWCRGCHEPGKLVTPRSVEQGSQGVDCLSCHAMTSARDLTGNGRYALRTPEEYPFAEARDPRLRWTHGFLMRLRPSPHRRSMRREELLPTAESCVPCHRTSYHVPQNGYKYVPGADEYGPWQASSYSGQSLRNPADEARSCAHCHMPTTTGSASHAFLGSNTALPALRDDRLHLAATRRFMRDGKIAVDLLALRRGREAAYELLTEASTSLRPAEEVAVDAVIRNRGVGHHFPGGSGDLQEVWLEATVRDASGRLVLSEGRLRPDGRLDPTAHAYRMLALDRTGRAIERNDLDRMVTTVPPFHPRTIPAGQADLVRYRFVAPNRPGRIRFTLRLLHRRVNPDFARVAGRHAALAADQLPITTIAEATTTFVVALPPLALTREPAPGRGREAEALRLLGYGHALLRRQDLANAARAMRRVTELLPTRPEGLAGLARVYLEEGDLIAARSQLEAARRLAPEDRTVHFLLGRTFREMGQYVGAAEILAPLGRQFPRDAALQFELGRCYFLMGRYKSASEAFIRLLDVDPNDLAGHYNLMVCYRQLRRFPEMRREEAIFRYLKEDESVRGLSARYLAAHPEIAREAESIHEHVLR